MDATSKAGGFTAGWPKAAVDQIVNAAKSFWCIGGLPIELNDAKGEAYVERILGTGGAIPRDGVWGDFHDRDGAVCPWPL